MVSQELLDYIHKQMSLGKTRTDINPVLLKAGWKQEDIDSAFQSLNQNPTAVISNPSGDLPSIGSLFSQSFHLFKQRIWLMVTGFITPILLAVAGAILAGGISFVVFKLNSLAGIITAIVLGLAAFVFYIYALSWAITTQWTALNSEQPLTFKDNLKTARVLAWSMLLVVLITDLVVVGGMILFIVPGIIFAVWYAFSPIVMVVEGKKGRAALAQSRAYVSGRSWPVLGRMLLLGLIYYVPAIVLKLVSIAYRNAILSGVLAVVLFIYCFLFIFYYFTAIFTLYNQLKATVQTQRDPQTYRRGIIGWLIWGIVAAIGLTISTGFAATSLSAKQAQARDQQRVNDIQALSVSLKLYYNDHQSYPTSLDDLVPGYVQDVPYAPEPADGTCSEQDNSYDYMPSQDQQSYNLQFCLGQTTQGFSAGDNTVTSGVSQPAAQDDGQN